MYSQNDETSILEVLEIKIFFTAQQWWEEQIFLKILSMDFTIQWWHLSKFLKNKKSKKSQNFSFYTIIRYSQNLREEIGNCE